MTATLRGAKHDEFTAKYRPVRLLLVRDDHLGRDLYSANGRPTLRDSIVAFVDELGVSARLKSLTSEQLCDDVARYGLVRLNFSASSGEFNRQLKVLYFSDNVGVRVSPSQSGAPAPRPCGQRR